MEQIEYRTIWSFDASSDAAQAARVEIFNRIANRENWKMPIAAWIDAADFAECSEAAVWFTGASLKIEARQGERILVTAPGYYATIGA
jgi:hypothetical protein